MTDSAGVDAPITEKGAEDAPEMPASAELTQGPGKHRIRWLSLCLAGSAIIATVVLAIELKFGLPLETSSTLLLAAIAGIGLPALMTMLAGRRLAARGIDRMRAWALICLLLIAVFSVILII